MASHTLLPQLPSLKYIKILQTHHNDLLLTCLQVAFDDVSKVAYMIGGQNLIVIDLSSSAVDVSASTAKVLPVLTVRELPTTTTDVVMCGDLLAVSAEGATKVSPGQVLLYTRYLRAAGSAADSMKLLANFTVGECERHRRLHEHCML